MGSLKTKVKAVDYKSPPGKDNEPPVKENVEVTHRKEGDENPGVVANAVTTARKTIQSIRDKFK
ncbi:hypothetical protein U1Q18_042492, partial [Sarracenia purpurea var. burkii]